MKSVASFFSAKTHISAIARGRWVIEPFERLAKRVQTRVEDRAGQRKLKRFRCQIDASMVSGRLAHINGRIKDFSAGGCLFRPASFYLVDRIGEDVTIELPDITINGKVVRTLPIGYAVQFEKAVDQCVFDEVLALSAVEAEVFAKTQEDETRETELKAGEKKSA